jgi:hypothetical protein
MTPKGEDDFLECVERERQEGARRSRGRKTGYVYYGTKRVETRLEHGCSLESLDRRIAKLIRANAEEYRQRHPRRWRLSDLRLWLKEMEFSSRRIERILWHAWNPLQKK